MVRSSGRTSAPCDSRRGSGPRPSAPGRHQRDQLGRSARTEEILQGHRDDLRRWAPAAILPVTTRLAIDAGVPVRTIGALVPTSVRLAFAAGATFSADATLAAGTSLATWRSRRDDPGEVRIFGRCHHRDLSAAATRRATATGAPVTAIPSGATGAGVLARDAR